MGLRRVKPFELSDLLVFLSGDLEILEFKQVDIGKINEVNNTFVLVILF